MRLISTISCVVYASTVLAAGGAAHGEGIVQRSSHKAIARDARLSGRTSVHAVPPSLRRKSTKKRDGKVQRRCRVRPTTSLASTATPTTTLHVSSTGSATSSAASETASIDNHHPNVPDSAWKLQYTSSGRSFFDDWNFWSYDDPTHGTVAFQDRDSSFNMGLAYVDGDGYAFMKADMTQYVDRRASVRIHSNHVFSGNTMVLLDAAHMPVGCGTWPAFWSNGPDWPDGGEVDILEGVHDSTINQASIHTGHGCNIQEQSLASGRLVGGTNCAAYESGNSGCGFQDQTYPNNYGKPFNDNGGGVYAMVWTDSDISVYFFPRGQIPDDITAEKPNPDNWHAPVAHWGDPGCNPATFFHDHFAIFDLTFCGDWAGNTWDSCAAKTGVGSCQEYVQTRGNEFGEAYWKVKYVKWFHLN